MIETAERMVQLWRRREVLTEVEWEELYKLVVRILKRSNPQILRSLPEEKENYIQDFFLFKVFEPAKHNSSCPYGANELCSYFNNYLTDVYRSLRPTDSIDDETDVEGGCGGSLTSMSPADSEFFDYKLTHQAVHTRAQAFLEQLDDVGRVYLSLHMCADAPEPLYKLAKQFRIPAYHYRATQLGITRKKGEFGVGYESTQIGSWLSKDLGLEVTYNPAVLSALKILCHETLYQHQQKRSLR